MQQTSLCPRCGQRQFERSHEMMALLPVAVRDGQVILKPSTALLTRPYTCAHCGFIEFYAAGHEVGEGFPDSEKNATPGRSGSAVSAQELEQQQVVEEQARRSLGVVSLGSLYPALLLAGNALPEGTAELANAEPETTREQSP